MEKLRAAMIGAGGRGMSHIKSLAAAPNIEFVAVCDVVEEIGKPVAEEFGVEYVPSTEELWKRDIDAVGICVQTPLHYDLAMEAIGQGKHLLTEKPMAGTIAQAREMMDTAAEKGLCAAISYQLRMGAVYRRMKEICEQIDPLQVLFARQRGMMADKYMSDAPFDGIMDFISHDIDMVPFLAGREPTAVFATTPRNIWANVDAIEVCSAHIEFDDGECIGVISSSMGGQGVPQRLDVVGREGIAVASGNTINYAIGPNPPAKTEPREMHTEELEAAGDSTMDLYEHWAACCLDPNKDLAPAASYRDGYNALLISLAICESGKTGEKVDLREFAEASE
ncbi:MAG: Gfo/Idh/MocA family oxidoreductase [Armatimonadetes bacterium]|nr:Gfo/Idh/MocA family oxidoreductase [Armatimonadota bacterium]